MQTNDSMDSSDIRAEETQEPSEKFFEEDGVSGDAGCEPPVCRPAGAAEAAGPLKKKHVLRSVLLGIGGVIVLLAVASVLFINSKLNKLNRSGSAIPQNPEEIAEVVGSEAEPEEELEEPPEEEISTEGMETRESGGELPEGEAETDRGIINILLIGTDELTNNLAWRANDLGRADSVILCSLNKGTGDIKLVSFERSLGVPMPDGKGDVKLSSSFNYNMGAGPQLTDIIRKCFLLDIDGYVHVDVNMFKDVIDAIGGVDIELTYKEADWIHHYTDPRTKTHPDVHEGMNHMDGWLALRYCRLRKVDSDWHRVERQRNTIQAIVDKLKGLSILELNEVADKLLPLVETDLTNAQIATYLLSAPRFLHATVSEQLTVPDRDNIWTYTGQQGKSMFGCDFNYEISRINKLIYGIETAETVPADEAGETETEADAQSTPAA